MKIVLSWLLDHLDFKVTEINIEKIVHLFNTRTAEIESFQAVNFNRSHFFAVQITATSAEVQAFCPELNQKITLPKRSDAITNKWYLAKHLQNSWQWVSLNDFHAEKDGLMPAVQIQKSEEKGSWKDSIPATDYILDIDNKSINHRPDLWGHYGIAREIAAFLNIKLKDLSKILHKSTIQEYKNTNNTEKNSLPVISLQATPACTRFAAILCNDVQFQDSAPWMAIRLAQVQTKPINAIVDLTNYVMFDIGHPTHAFDAKSFSNGEIIIRMAQNKEKLELLDGQSLELTNSDIVIANNNQTVSLGGIMGGNNSGIQNDTKNIILEAAAFDPSMIRKTAQRLKLRTEACIRFEKHLDPMQNITAIQRFLFLAEDLKIISKKIGPIISIGQVIKPATCSLSHEFVEKKLGTTLKPESIEKMLTALNFGVTYDAKKAMYTVIIPTTRMTKDINIAEDLVEEIVRSYGFENLQASLPERSTKPFDTQIINNVEQIKRYFAFSMNMHEVRDYLLYDAAFIAKLNIDTTHAIHVKNPMSQNWVTLTTSLIPHLLKNIESNSVGNNHLRFFEYNRIWYRSNKALHEQKTISGIIFDKKQVDFYQTKSELQRFFDMLKINATWQKPTDTVAPWFDQHQVAEIQTEGHVIGHAGMMSTSWMHKVLQGSAFIFELNTAFLEQHQQKTKQFSAWSKFQDVCYDISLFIPLTCVMDQLKQTIFRANENIKSVELIDFCQKEEWPDKRAVTLRYTMNNDLKTMTKQEIDEIVAKVAKAVVIHGAQIR
jgi:phenylalanyl-tRNA synthetase beta chain